MTGTTFRHHTARRPGYLSLIQTDFDHAGEKAWGVGLTYDFGGTLLPFRAPGFLARLAYARGTGIVDPSTGASKPDEWEVDLDLTWNVAAVKGLPVPVPQRLLGQRGNADRIPVPGDMNYEFDLL